MKNLTALIIFTFIITVLFGQDGQFLTNSSIIKLSGVKDRESLEWEKTVSFAEPPFPIPRPLLRGQFEQILMDLQLQA